MKTKSLLLLPIMALLFTGCAIVPIPLPSKDSAHGKAISANDVRFIVPGQTTRAEVVARLGDQFRDSPRLPVLAYSWEKPAIGIGWVWIVMTPGVVGSGFVERSHWRAFFVKFDAIGRVGTTKFVSLSSHRSLGNNSKTGLQKQVIQKMATAFLTQTQECRGLSKPL